MQSYEAYEIANQAKVRVYLDIIGRAAEKGEYDVELNIPNFDIVYTLRDEYKYVLNKVEDGRYLVSWRKKR